MSAILFVRLHQFKRQMRLFTKRLLKKKNRDVNQIVTVEYFDRDVERLASALNEYTDMVRLKTKELESDRKHLKNVIAGISHDFRTPLTSAKGYLQLIEKSGTLDAKNREYLNIAMNKTDHLRALSDTFFEISSLEANDEPVHLEQLNVTRLLSELCIDQYEWIQAQSITAFFDIPEQDIFVRSNKAMLGRILGNLFANAQKYSAPYLKVSLAKDNGKILILFENDTEEEIHVDKAQLFDAFYRDASRHREGAGLGLYVVKCLCGKMNHSVWAEVEGCVFKVGIRL